MEASSSRRSKWPRKTGQRGKGSAAATHRHGFPRLHGRLAVIKSQIVLLPAAQHCNKPMLVLQDAGHASTRSASTFIDMTKEDCGRELRSGRAARKGVVGGASDAREYGSDLDIELSLSSDSSWGSE